MTSRPQIGQLYPACGVITPPLPFHQGPPPVGVLPAGAPERKGIEALPYPASGGTSPYGLSASDGWGIEKALRAQSRLWRDLVLRTRL